MNRAKVAITINQNVLRRLDHMVRQGHYQNRSQAIEAAVTSALDRIERTRLAVESAKLDPAFEQAIADEGLAGDLDEWPEY